jgi:hypothetical protein
MSERVGFGGTVTITRPADVLPYAAGDVIGNTTAAGGAVLEFKPMGRYDRELMITSARLLVFDSALIASEAGYRLHLYAVTPPSAFADNSPWDLPAGDRAAYRGFIDMGTPADLGSTLVAQVNQIQHQFPLATSSSIFGYLQTIGAYTPTSGRQYRQSLRSMAL